MLPGVSRLFYGRWPPESPAAPVPHLGAFSAFPALVSSALSKRPVPPRRGCVCPSAPCWVSPGAVSLHLPLSSGSSVLRGWEGCAPLLLAGSVTSSLRSNWKWISPPGREKEAQLPFSAINQCPSAPPLLVATGSGQSCLTISCPASWRLQRHRGHSEVLVIGSLCSVGIFSRVLGYWYHVGSRTIRTTMTLPKEYI